MKPAGKKDVLFNAFNDHELLFIVNDGVEPGPRFRDVAGMAVWTFGLGLT